MAGNERAGNVRAGKSGGSGRGRQAEALVAVEGRLQPQARELEEAVLGALLLEKDAFLAVSEILTAECFYEPAHGKIYSAMVDLSLSERPIDILTVVEQLKKRGQLEEVGGAFYISRLTEHVASSAHVEYHARIVAQKHVARELIGYTATVQGKAFDESTDVEELMQEAEARLFEISQRNIRKGVMAIKPVVAEALELLKKAAAAKEGVSGLHSGFHGLDRVTAGWQKSDLIIVAARPSMGKTAFALSMAKNMALDYGTAVGVFSLEMSNVQLVNRLIVNVAEIEGEKIKSGRLEDYEWAQLDMKLKDLHDAPIYIDDTPSMSIIELRSKARRLVREHGVGCIMVDYLQLMSGGSAFSSREQEVSAISRSLKSLAKELDIPVIALAQLNRNVDLRSSGGRRPQLADLRESGAIEQDADIVCFIHRPEYYGNVEDTEVGVAYLIIAKHRNGATGDVRLRFRSEYAKFMNIDEGGDAGVVYQSAVNRPGGGGKVKALDGNGKAAGKSAGSAGGGEDYIVGAADEGMPF